MTENVRMSDLHFEIHLDSPRKGFATRKIPAVPAKDPAGFLMYDKRGNRGLFMPCPETLYAALPHYYRRAHDRTKGHIRRTHHGLGSVSGSGSGAGKIFLKNGRGKILNSVCIRAVSGHQGL